MQYKTDECGGFIFSLVLVLIKLIYRIRFVLIGILVTLVRIRDLVMILYRFLAKVGLIGD